ncbi:MAG: hypothetical protein JSV99_06065 [Planctomycetota bacterium]|nr:MAG: hypothetical protein JSV99_06065 [Planctomycetota bacterium]
MDFLEWEAVKDLFEVMLNWPLILTLVAGNLVGDYLSLLETQWLLQVASRRTLRVLPLLLVLDIVFSLLCYGVIVGSTFWVAWEHHWGATYGRLVWAILCSLGNSVSSIEGLTPFAYSTLFTSAVFYALVGSAFLIRLLLVLKVPVSSILGWLGRSKNPVKTAAGVAAGVVLILEGLRRVL